MSGHCDSGLVLRCLEPTVNLTPFRLMRFTEGKLIRAQYEYAGNTCTHTTAAPE
jgi:hypothetical protein